VLDGARIVQVDLLAESLEVVCRRPHLAIATACDSRNMPQVRAICFLIVVIIIVSHKTNSLRTLLAPLLAALGALLGIMDGDVG
jgi:hypothetical protein